MRPVACLTAMILASISFNAIAADTPNNIPKELIDLSQKTKFPPSVCSITNIDDAPKLCMPGEILWFAPQRWDPNGGLMPVAVAANYCDLDRQIIINNASVTCYYQKHNYSVSRDLAMRFPTDVNNAVLNKYKDQFVTILNQNPSIENHGDFWLQEISIGDSEKELNEGDKLEVEFAMLNGKLTGYPEHFKYMQYSLEDLKNPQDNAASLVKALDKYYNKPKTELMIYSIDSFYPDSMENFDLFTQSTPKTMKVVIGNITTAEEIKQEEERARKQLEENKKQSNQNKKRK